MKPVHLVKRPGDGVLAWFSEADLGSDAEDLAAEMARDVGAFVTTVFTEDEFYGQVRGEST